MSERDVFINGRPIGKADTAEIFLEEEPPPDGLLVLDVCPEWWVAYFYTPGGGIIGFYNHPNKLAVDQKVTEVLAENPTWISKTVRYARTP